MPAACGGAACLQPSEASARPVAFSRNSPIAGQMMSPTTKKTWNIVRIRADVYTDMQKTIVAMNTVVDTSHVEISPRALCRRTVVAMSTTPSAMITAKQV